MDPLHAIVLGIVQGLTEFIPVSSTGHLVVIPALLGWPEQSLAFDTVLPLGTLLAVLAYFRHDWLHIADAWLNSIFRRRIELPEERLAWLIVVGCVPAAIAGMLFEKWFEQMFARPVMVGYFLVVTAGILVAGEVLSGKQRELAKLRLSDAVVVGLAQALAILPGVSRSGSTISGGLLVGLTRSAAARFSFLLATPIIFGAGVTQLPRALREQHGASSEALALALGFAAAAIVGYLSISYMLRYLRRGSLYPFAAYCAVVGVVVAVVLRGVPV